MVAIQELLIKASSIQVSFTVSLEFNLDQSIQFTESIIKFKTTFISSVTTYAFSSQVDKWFPEHLEAFTMLLISRTWHNLTQVVLTSYVWEQVIYVTRTNMNQMTPIFIPKSISKNQELFQHHYLLPAKLTLKLSLHHNKI